VNRTSEFFPSDIGSELTTLIGLLDNVRFSRFFGMIFRRNIPFYLTICIGTTELKFNDSFLFRKSQNKSGSEENFSADIKELIEALRAGEDFERILETKIISENRGHFQYIKGSIYNTRKRAIVNYRKSTMC